MSRRRVANGRVAWILAMLSLSGCVTTPIEPTLHPTDPLTPTLAPSALPEPDAFPGPTNSTEPTPSPEPTLHVDGMATVGVDGLRQVVDPTNPGANLRLNRLLGRLDSGQHMYLVDGPRAVSGRDYFQLMIGPVPGPNMPLGWAATTDGAGAPALIPFEPQCPSAEGLTAQAIRDLGSLEALACFGDRELVLSGIVECNRATADGIIGGAYYLDSNRHCAIDDALAVFGTVVTAILEERPAPIVAGKYELRGHFDDHGARGVYLDSLWYQPGVGERTARAGTRDGLPAVLRRDRAHAHRMSRTLSTCNPTTALQQVTLRAT